MDDKYLESEIALSKFVEERTIDGAIFDLTSVAKRITRNTPLSSDSWDDSEEWQMEAVKLAHGFLALVKAMQNRDKGFKLGNNSTSDESARLLSINGDYSI